MPYPRNTVKWEVGDYVIHSGDAKKSYMLMKVIGCNPRTGIYKTVYIQDNHFPGMNDIMENDLKYLLDPADFGITIPQVKKEKESVNDHQ